MQFSGDWELKISKDSLKQKNFELLEKKFKLYGNKNFFNLHIENKLSDTLTLFLNVSSGVTLSVRYKFSSKDMQKHPGIDNRYDNDI